MPFPKSLFELFPWIELADVWSFDSLLGGGIVGILALLLGVAGLVLAIIGAASRRRGNLFGLALGLGILGLAAGVGASYLGHQSALAQFAGSEVPEQDLRRIASRCLAPTLWGGAFFLSTLVVTAGVSVLSARTRSRSWNS